MTDRPIFFVHIMKTAGATFRQHLFANVGERSVYPNALVDDDVETANYSIERLAALRDERRSDVRVYAGHFPWAAVGLIDPRPVTMTLLRDPVARTISYLRHCERLHDRHRGLALEAIYEDPFVFPCLIQNHQAKIFAMRREDRFESYMDVLEVDEDRLTLAKENLEQVDLLGLTDDFDGFTRRVADRLDWTFGPVQDRHVPATRVRVPRSFRRRIERDNQADLEFVEYARDLIRERDR